MAEKRTLVRAKAGVRLERVEDLAGKQRSLMFRLATHRPPQPRFISDEKVAMAAFDEEVKLSLADPVIVALMQRGVL